MASSLSDILATLQQGVQALNNLGQRLASPWTVFTPTVTVQTGAFGAVSATGRFKTIGKTAFVSMVVTVTTTGTAAGVIFATIPLTAGPGVYVLAGRENAVTGNMLQGFINPGNAVLNILTYNNAYAGGNGFVLDISGVFELA